MHPITERNDMDLPRKLTAEFLGTAALLAIVVGSGIMAERLAGGNAGIALLANSIATGLGLAFLIYGLGNISGAHFNPAVTGAAVANCDLGPASGVLYVASQFAGGIVGTIVANIMFELPAVNISNKVRVGAGQFLGECVATFGLIGVIALFTRFHPKLTGAMVACYIVAACWFTSSTSFANPAVTVARTLSNTFAGIAPESIGMFVLAQLVGASISFVFFKWLTVSNKNNE